MTLEEYLRIRLLLTTTTSILKVDSQNHQMNVNNLHIVNTLTVHQKFIRTYSKNSSLSHICSSPIYNNLKKQNKVINDYIKAFNL